MKAYHLVSLTSYTPICKLGNTCEKYGVTCGQRSLYLARKAQTKMRAAGFMTLIRPGPCPTGASITSNL
jgi:hypothetical protein